MEIQGIGVAIATHQPPSIRHTLVGVQAIITPRPTNMGYVNTQGEIIVSCIIEFSAKSATWLKELRDARTRFLQEIRGIENSMVYVGKVIIEPYSIASKITVSQEVVL
jgi:hypothetical protein